MKYVLLTTGVILGALMVAEVRGLYIWDRAHDHRRNR